MALCSPRKSESNLCCWNGRETVEGAGSVDQLYRECKVMPRDQGREVERNRTKNATLMLAYYVAPRW